MYTREYSTAAGVPTAYCAALQAAFEPLFIRYGVNLYFSGHQHAYESVWPVYNGTRVWANFSAPPCEGREGEGRGGGILTAQRPRTCAGHLQSLRPPDARRPRIHHLGRCRERRGALGLFDVPASAVGAAQ